ncbi:helix-turn-helix domain-containing protein [Rubripirellula sp.]|nr:helix-turn-helix domain-containing protein [Rubripirellula sp.]
MPRKKRYRSEEIIHKPREDEVAFPQGKSTGEVCRKLGVSKQTYCRRRRK